MRLVSLSARRAQDATASDEVEVLLIRITHPAIDEPIRLSTDDTTAFSFDPLIYCTWSTWMIPAGTTAPLPYLFGLVSVQLPDDQEDAPQSAKIVLEVVDQDMATPLRSTTTRALVDLAVVLASSPNVIEAEWTGIELVTAEGDASTITLTLSRQPITSEPFPARRMTRAAFPGVNR